MADCSSIAARTPAGLIAFIMYDLIMDNVWLQVGLKVDVRRRRIRNSNILSVEECFAVGDVS